MNQMILEDGDYSYVAGADFNPGDIVTRPDGTLAIVDGVEVVKSGQMFAPKPLKPCSIVRFDSGSSSTFAVGDTVYWDASGKVATATSSGNTNVGKAIRAKVSGQLFVEVNTTA